jgi:adenylate cyclase
MVTPHASVAEQTMLVAFTDIAGFARAAAHLFDQPAEMLALMDAYFELVGDIVESAGGRVVKCIGDAALIVFPVAQVDAGVQALVQLKEQGDAWLARQGLACRQQIKAHYGSLAGGPVGTRSAKLWDVYGEAVNGAARLPSTGLALSPEAFRQLGPETRRLFKKHTAQVVYIRAEDRRPAT